MRRLVSIAALLAPTLVVVGCGRSKVDPFAEEVREREALAKTKLVEADAGRALSVSSTSEVQFEEGVGILMYEPDSDGHPSFTNHAFRWLGQNAHVRLKTHDSHPMRIQMDGWVHHKVIGAWPVISLYVDGVYIGSTNPIGGTGHFSIDMQVADWAIRRPWVDLVIRTNAVGYHWGDPPELKVLNISRFAWSEAK
ncbi:MAG TPA: hypothetical protein VM925_25850 [Labilithrix sp.]|nr:hypothetical protein [Labilithrix sp.]